jgi:predicted Rossmann fold flavoprotein
MGSNQHFDVLVVGGGAAGLMAAGRAAERGKKVLLLEKNSVLGKKLSITGGGRCNVTNAEEDLSVLLRHYGGSEQFLYSPFTQFGIRNTFQFFEARGLPLVVEERKRAFPHTQTAHDVVRVLKEYVAQGNVTVHLRMPVTRIESQDGHVAVVYTAQGGYTADAYVFATGGLSHPETGSTGDGFAWLRDLGHTVKAPTPTIVPLRASASWIKILEGRTIPDAKISFYQGSKRKFSVRGSILLTHFGLSGPVILNSAVQVADLLHAGIVEASLDLFPEHDIGALDAELVRHFDTRKNKTLRNALREFVPPVIEEALFLLARSVDSQKKTHSVTKEERRALIDAAKGLSTRITGLMGYDRAVVADGGVPLTEIDTRTMRSLCVKNAYIIGDLLHIKRPSGGYSLQLCWTTGYVAGSAV